MPFGLSSLPFGSAGRKRLAPEVEGIGALEAAPTIERWRLVVVALATVAALPMFLFEDPESPAAATGLSGAAPVESIPAIPVSPDLLSDPILDFVEESSVSIVPRVSEEHTPMTTASSVWPVVTNPVDSQRLEVEARAAEERLFEEEAIAVAAEIAAEEFQTYKAVTMFIAAKQAEVERQALRKRLREEEEDRRARALASSAPTTTIPSDTEPATGGPSPEQWEALRFCESTGDYTAVNPSGAYRGAYQFSRTTWDWIAGIYAEDLVGVDPAVAMPADQDSMAQWLYGLRGRGQWPVCGRYLP